MIPLWKHPVVAIDIRTTGTDPERHEICQLAAVRLNSDLKPKHGVDKLILTITPDYRDAVNTTYLTKYCMPFEQLVMTGCSQNDAVRIWRDWAGGLPILPVCWRWDLIHPFMHRFAGSDFYKQPVRELMGYAAYVHDRHWFFAYNPGFTSFTRQRIYAACEVSCVDMKSAILTCLADVECIRHLLKHMVPN